MEPLDIEELMNRPSATEEPPTRAIGDVTRYVNMVAERAAAEAMQEHLRVHHASQKHIEAGGWLNRLYRANRPCH